MRGRREGEARRLGRAFALFFSLVFCFFLGLLGVLEGVLGGVLGFCAFFLLCSGVGWVVCVLGGFGFGVSFWVFGSVFCVSVLFLFWFCFFFFFVRRRVAGRGRGGSYVPYVEFGAEQELLPARGPVFECNAHGEEGSRALSGSRDECGDCADPLLELD